MLASTLRLGGTAGLALALLSLVGAGPALAQRDIGSAIAIEREVSAALAGRVRTLGVGNGVFSNERIQTANQAAAQLQFLDQSRLRIGPSATVVLDRFVFNPDRTAQAGTVQVTTGAARWISGASRPGSHRVRTPHAVIGVRGTVFDVIVESRRTVVTLREGIITVCPIAAQSNCLTLDRPGQTVIVTTTTIQRTPESVSPTRFADLCLAPVDRASCSHTTTAQLGPEPTWDGFRAGIHGGFASSRAAVTVSGSPAVEASIAAGNVPRFLDPNGAGFIGGFQASYSRQSGIAVFGVDADISGLAARGRDNVTVNPFGVIVSTTAEHNLDVLATLRGRAGVAFDRFHVFATGGLAVGHINLQGSIIPNPAANPTYVGSRSLVKAGYVYGGGIEHAFAGGFSIRAEYLHYDLGSSNLLLNETTGLAPGEFATMRFRTSGDIGWIALNFRF
jgi:opacity protein-like surface antigen